MGQIHAEELVFAHAKDGIFNGGVRIAPAAGAPKPIAIIWIHGWGANFYYPTYVIIGRALAARGYACITGNTRMHDIGTIMGWREGQRLRGGGYWGRPSEEAHDLAAWIDFAASRGHRAAVLVGHSAGAAAVRGYQAERQDPRVVGLILASGGVRPPEGEPDPALVARAARLVADGLGEELLSLHRPGERRPRFISAATYLEGAQASPEQRDFFGVRTPHAAVARVRCPILAWYGTNEPTVGTAADLELLRECIARQPSGPSRVDTVMLQNADHMYTGEEAQVAETVAAWVEALAP